MEKNLSNRDREEEDYARERKSRGNINYAAGIYIDIAHRDTDLHLKCTYIGMRCAQRKFMGPRENMRDRGRKKAEKRRKNDKKIYARMRDPILGFIVLHRLKSDKSHRDYALQTRRSRSPSSFRLRSGTWNCFLWDTTEQTSRGMSEKFYFAKPHSRGYQYRRVFLFFVRWEVRRCEEMYLRGKKNVSTELVSSAAIGVNLSSQQLYCY